MGFANKQQNRSKARKSCYREYPKMKMFAVLIIAQVVFLVTCEENKDGAAAAKPVERKEQKSANLRERLQNIAQDSKRAKRYYHYTTRSSYNEYDYGYTTNCRYDGCYCTRYFDCDSYNCVDNRCSDSAITAMPYYPTRRIVSSEEYRDEEEENERDEERIQIGKNNKAKNSNAKNSNVKNSDAKNSNVKNSNIKNSDIKNSDVKNSDAKNKDVKKSDFKNSNVKRNDVKKV